MKGSSEVVYFFILTSAESRRFYTFVRKQKQKENFFTYTLKSMKSL